MSLFTFGTLETVEIPGAGLPHATNDATAKAPLGVLLKYKGNLFRYVKHDPGTAVATAAGAPAYWRTLNPLTGVYTVSSDYTDSIAGINGVAGVYGGVVTALYYTWLQVGGVALQCKFKDGSVALGAKAMGYASADVQFDYVTVATAATGNVYGIVVGNIDITNYKADVLLQNLAW